jgi:hypothetical protein
MVFNAHAGLHIDHIPDDIILPDLVFNPHYGRRPLSQSNSSVFIDAPSGMQFTLDQVKERTESFAKGFKSELNIESGWKGIIGVFAPNHVLPFVTWFDSRLILQRCSGGLTCFMELYRL